jgi:hypothetical protein
MLRGFIQPFWPEKTHSRLLVAALRAHEIENEILSFSFAICIRKAVTSFAVQLSTRRVARRQEIRRKQGGDIGVDVP